MVRQVNTEPGNKGGGWSGDPAELTCASGPRWVLLPARYFMVSNLWDSNIVFKPATSVSIFMLVWVKWQSCSALWNTHTRAHTISRAHSFKGSVLLSINTNHFHEFSLRLSKHLFMLCFLETRYKHRSRWAHTNLGSGQRHNQSLEEFCFTKGCNEMKHVPTLLRDFSPSSCPGEYRSELYSSRPATQTPQDQQRTHFKQLDSPTPTASWILSFGIWILNFCRQMSQFKTLRWQKWVGEERDEEGSDLVVYQQSGKLAPLQDDHVLLYSGDLRHQALKHDLLTASTQDNTKRSTRVS